MLRDAGYLSEDVQREIAKATKKQEREIREAFRDACIRSDRYDRSVYRAAGRKTSATFTASPYFKRLMERAYRATGGEWVNFTRTTAEETQRLFIRECDKAYHLVSSGALSRTQAFAEAVERIAKDGVYVEYPSGHRDTIETATLRCVRTGVAQSTAEITLAGMEEHGDDLIIVSSHLGARPSHYVWQGKIYSKSGKNKKYPDFYESTGYGTGAGLCGWNCRHSFSPYFEGMDNPFKDFDSEENKKTYDLEQQQRTLERRIRGTKREVAAMNTAMKAAPDGVTDEFRQKYRSKAALLKRQNEQYNEFCRENGMKRLDDRLKIAEWNRSEAARASAAAREAERAAEALKNPPSGGIIETENRSEAFKAINSQCVAEKVEYREVKKLAAPLTSDEIIQRISGGDKTGGSCVSLAYAYAGNVSGFDCLDYRGGESTRIFSLDRNAKEIINLPNVRGKFIREYNEFTGVHSLLREIEENKEYILGAGKHTAVVRKTARGCEFLELQDSDKDLNGFKKLTDERLKNRFGCQKSYTFAGFKSTGNVYIIDIESLGKSKEFKTLLGYINTADSSQMKGVDGGVK